MGTFTQLGERDFVELAGAFGLPPISEHQAIAAGTINSNFRIVAGAPYFLRVNEGKSEEDVAYEAALVVAFAAGGVPTPPPLAAQDGRRYALLGSSRARSGTLPGVVAPIPAPSTTPTLAKWVSVFPWRAGKHLTEITPPIARSLGAALAQLHLVGLAQPATMQRSSIYDHAHLVERFRSFEHSTDPTLAPAIAVLRSELADHMAVAAARRAATQGIIHGDLFRDNVLWEGDQIVAILDFEQASGGSLAYDLAVSINDWCWADGIQFELVAALLDGYRSIRPLTDGDRAALLIEVRAAAARFTITRITDVYLAKVSNPEKDFRAFLARVEAWGGHALGQLSSLM